MPFDPKRGGDVGFGGYANPYAAPPSNQHKSKKPNYILFAMIAILLLGIVTGVVFFMKTAASNQNAAEPNTSVTDKSNYVEVEIFDVQEQK